MKTNDLQCMVDIETFAQTPNAAIASIGAVKFSLTEGIIDTFYQTVDVKDCKNYGLVVHSDTVNWWKQQPKHVMEGLLKDTLPLKDALTKFSVWYGSAQMPTWGNGSSFDNVILQWAYDAVGIRRPWRHWNDRCFRTLKNLIVVPEPNREGDHHNALDDAKHQTMHLLKIMGS